MKALIIILILAINCTLLISQSNGLGCLNPQGQSQDWWVALKLPNGTQYAYFDSTTKSSLKFYPSLSDPTSPLTRTMAQIKQYNSPSYASIFWNDQTPDKNEHFDFAHAKGLMATDASQGFLLVHSVPGYPSYAGGQITLEIPSSGQMYGQHFFCVNIDKMTADKYAAMLLIDRPYSFDCSSVPASLKSALPYMTSLLDNSKRQLTNTGTVSFSSRGGASFTKFAKSKDYKVPFYSAVLAKYYKTDFVVETWGSGGLQPADCSGPKVVSSLQITMSKDVQFGYLNDHSKYATAFSQSISCFGDINRQDSQNSRGGGTVCLNDASVHNLVSSLFTQRQTCPGYIQSQLRRILNNE